MSWNDIVQIVVNAINWRRFFQKMNDYKKCDKLWANGNQFLFSLFFPFFQSLNFLWFQCGKIHQESYEFEVILKTLKFIQITSDVSCPIINQLAKIHCFFTMSNSMRIKLKTLENVCLGFAYIAFTPWASETHCTQRTQRHTFMEAGQ